MSIGRARRNYRLMMSRRWTCVRKRTRNSQSCIKGKSVANSLTCVVNHASWTCATIRCLLETSDTDIGQFFFTQPNPTQPNPTQLTMFSTWNPRNPCCIMVLSLICLLNIKQKSDYAKNEDDRIKERCRRRKHLTREANQYIHVKSSTNNCTRPYIPSHYITAVQAGFSRRTNSTDVLL